MKKHIAILIILTTSLISPKVLAEVPTITYEFNGDVTINWIGPWCIVPKNTWDDNHYQLKIRKSGTLLWDKFYTASPSSDYTLEAGYFEPGARYDVRVKYHGRRLDCGAHQIIKVRRLGDTSFIYNYEPDIPGEAVKVRNENTGKCIYPFAPAGPISTRMHNWSCWNDPNFAFMIEPVGSDEVRLRSLAASQCLQPVDNADYQEIKGGSCSSVYSEYYIDYLSAETFRLRNKVNNKCIYGSTSNGGKIRQFGCWANPDMVFSFSSY